MVLGGIGMRKVIHHLTVKDGSTMYYEVMGKGDPLVLLHGNGGSTEYFSKQVSALGKHYRLYIIDSRGRGHSTDLSPHISFQLMAEDLLEILQHEQLSKINLLGFSDGANLALLFAQEHPEMINSLILNAGNHHFDDLTEDTREAFRWHRHLLRVGARLHPFLHRVAHYYNLAFETIRLDADRIHQIKAPVLILVGEKDIVKPSFSHHLAALFHHSELIIEPETGHRFARVKPKTYNQYVLSFLKYVPKINE